MQNAEGLLDQALRVFGLLGALLVAVIEIEWERLLQLVRFTEYWVGRAIVQARLGPLFLFVYDMTTCQRQQTVRLSLLLGRCLAVAVMGLAACGMQLQGQWLLPSHCSAAAAALGAWVNPPAGHLCRLMFP